MSFQSKQLLADPIYQLFFDEQEAPTQSTLGFVPFALTIVVHVYLSRNVMTPLNNLSLEVAAQVDIEDGELEPVGASEDSLYSQPSLKDKPGEREPLPYRREDAPQGTFEAAHDVSREVTLDEETFEIIQESTEKKNPEYFM